MNKSILRFAFMLLVSFLFIVGTKAQTAGAAISKANLPTPVTVFEDPYQGIPVRIPAMTINTGMPHHAAGVPASLAAASRAPPL